MFLLAALGSGSSHAGLIIDQPSGIARIAVGKTAY